MKKQFFGSALIGLSLLCACLTSCDKKEDNPNPPTPSVKPETKAFEGLLLSCTITNPDGASGQSYLQALADYSRKHYDNKNALPTGFGVPPIAFPNGHIYSFPDYLGNSKSEISRYSVNAEGSLKLEGKLSIPAKASACNIVEAGADKAYVSLQGIDKIYAFNPQTMTKTAEIDLTPYNGEGTHAAPAAMVIRDGILYAGLSQFNSQWMPLKSEIQIAIVDTKTDKVTKIAKNTSLGLCVPTRPIDRFSIFTDEAGDIYFSCIGSFGFIPNLVGGVARIKKGSTDIDPNYSIPLTTTKVEGLSVNYINCLTSFFYAGGGIAYGYGTAPQLDPNNNNPYLAQTGVPLEINLKAKTMRRIEGIPISGPHTFYITRHGDKILFGSANKENNGVYSYDPQTKKSEGLLFTTEGIPSFIYSYKPNK